ncbi:hypothetical protein CRG98_023216 [Punica granatum]|uniref:Uncharacterized protein n=1 Tax=Punica granatum TaxID=22663 RepID=A0A2I0JKC8_PUNGR|nr:hypothetical protein CRG98_023216 [Punica granatum]
MADHSPQSSSEVHGDEENDSPIEEVRLTVPTTDDPTQPVLTFRTLILGLTSCIVLAFVNQFFIYRQNPLYISPVSFQIVALPLGMLMAMTLPSKPIKVPLTDWSFSMNPGPFNLKEHVLISMFAASGANNVGAVHIITSALAYYHWTIHPLAAFLLAQTTQLLGYGWAGLFRKYLVDSPYMWWPSSLAQVSFFRRFPMISAHAFDSEGQTYNISRILNRENFEINWAAYDGYSKLYLSVTFAFNSIGLGFAALTATLSHVALFHGQ